MCIRDRMTTVGNIGDQLTHFEDIRALEGDIDPVNRRKRKLKSNPRKKKGIDHILSTVCLKMYTAIKFCVMYNVDLVGAYIYY